MDGTITMLFTDVEASTLLLQRLGSQWAAALSAQRAAVRAAIARFAGREMGTEGDSFFVVFAAAADAAGAAVAAQRALAATDWPAGVRLRVRMGLHTGEPTPHEDGFVGLDVHRAARVAAAAHGGQILLSGATAALVAEALPDGCRLHELGEFRLKDLPAPERLVQLEPAELAERFAPPRSLGARSALPPPASPTVGRRSEIADLSALVADPAVRLVTITGPGGVGKTRVALATAHAVAGAGEIDTYFATLAGVTRDEEIWPVIAETLGVGEGAEAVAGTVDRLAGRRAVLVLDNLEHLPGAVAVVRTLIEQVPGLTVLATSRSPLRLPGEREFDVGPLPSAAPDPAARRELDAVQLFAQRARAARASFTLDDDDVCDDVTAICALVDGMPLAIELAAARIKLLSPAALRRRLQDTLDVLGADPGRDSRHRSLEATIAWSYDLLPETTQRVVRRCGVFAGGFDLTALAAVCLTDEPGGDGLDPLEVLAELVDVSLCRVQSTSAGEPRGWMLRAVREFALSRLREHGELDPVAARHAAVVADGAEAADADIHGARQEGAVAWFRAERDNVSAALAWCLNGDRASGEQVFTALRIVRAASFFWFSRTPGAQARTWLGDVVHRLDALDADGTGITAQAQFADVLHGLALQVGQQGKLVTAEELLQRALGVREALGDLGAVSMELNSLGVFARAAGDVDRGADLLERSAEAARAAGDQRRLVNALSNLAVVAVDRGEFDRALPLLTEIVEMDRAAGDLWAVAADEVNMAVALLHLGRAEQARTVLVSCAPHVRAVGDTELDVNLVEALALLLSRLGHHAPAARLSGAASRFRDDADLPMPEPDAARVATFYSHGRDRLGAAAWDDAVSAGRALRLDEATDLGLDLAATAAPPV